MPLNAFPSAHDQVLDRRHKLEAAIHTLGPQPELVGLLAEVDAALDRLAMGTYGLCETCHDAIEADRLIADPITRFCLDHLSASEQRALEQDLELAARVQLWMLPDPMLAPPSWDIAYHYEASRVVSGDYCDLMVVNNHLCFMVGDVSGKGVAAATLMAQLHAMLHALMPADLPLNDLMTRASRLFCESTLPMHYATMVCGRATSEGEVEICNAGHVPVLVQRDGEVRTFGATGLPIGMFTEQQFAVERIQLRPGDGLLLVTDGVSEAESADGEQFGLERLTSALQARRSLASAPFVSACMADVRAHAGERRHDDTTVFAMRYRGA